MITNEGMDRIFECIKIAEPKPFLNPGDVAEIEGRYYKLDCIDNMKHKAYFTEIEIHKLKVGINVYVELV